MDISNKIKKIREENGLTQEQFANELFVSRTAVSKWELGKGYPSIDSLKLISKKFNISLDTLLSSNDILDIAEQDIIVRKNKSRNLFTAILDIFAVLILFLPFFAEKVNDDFVCLPLFACKDISPLNLFVFTLITCLLIFCGILELVNIKLESKKFEKVLFFTTFILSILAVVFFIECREIYASTFVFGLLVAKGFFYIKK